MLCTQVVKPVDGGSTVLFAFRGSFDLTDWGTNFTVKMVVLGAANDLFPNEAIDAGARVHVGFLDRFRATLGATDALESLHNKVTTAVEWILPSD